MTCNLRHPMILCHPVYAYIKTSRTCTCSQRCLNRPARCKSLSATHYITLHHTATNSPHCTTTEHTTMLHYTATHSTCCTTTEHTAANRNTPQHTTIHYSTSQHIAAHCSTLQHIAAHCNSTPKHTATPCNTLSGRIGRSTGHMT